MISARSGRSAAIAVLSLAAFSAAAIFIADAVHMDVVVAVALLPLAAAAVLALYAIAYVGLRSVMGDRFAGMLTAAVYIFITCAVFRLRAYSDKSIDWQVAMRLAAFGAIFVTALAFLSHAYGRFRFPPLFFIWLLFFGYLIVVSLYAPNVVFSLTCTVLFFICYLYSTYLTVWLSRPRAILVMIWAAILLCVGSIFVYYFVPAMGRMQGFVPGEGIITDVGRMKGLVGSANGVGLVSAFSIVIAVLYYRTLDRYGRLAAAFLIPNAALCLYLANSRTSMIGVATAIWISFVLRRDTGPKLFVSLTLGLIGAVALIGFPDEIFSLISRSGNTAEITNVTGRTDIWAVVLDNWKKSPIIGYGYSATLFILPLDPRLFRTAAHAHSMMLELLFSGGIILVGLFLFALVNTIIQIVRMRAINEGALLFFFFLHGLVESSPFSGMVGYSSFSFTLTLSLVISKLMQRRAYVALASAYAQQFSAPRAAPALQRSPS